MVPIEYRAYIPRGYGLIGFIIISFLYEELAARARENHATTEYLQARYTVCVIVPRGGGAGKRLQTSLAFTFQGPTWGAGPKVGPYGPLLGQQLGPAVAHGSPGLPANLSTYLRPLKFVS